MKHISDRDGQTVIGMIFGVISLLFVISGWTTIAHSQPIPFAVPYAQERTVFFDFGIENFVSDSGEGIDPIFRVADLNGFTFVMSHSPGRPPARGNAQWLAPGSCPLVSPTNEEFPPPGNGCMRLWKDGRTNGRSAVSATINFSKAVGAVTMQVATVGGTALIEPIPAPGVQGPVQAPTSLENPNGEWSLYQITSGGPYIGIKVTASQLGGLLWDDMSVTPYGATIISDIPMPAGENQVSANTAVLQSIAASVSEQGLADTYVCVGHDQRWEKLSSGDWTFNSRYLNIEELSIYGTCNGLLPTGDLTWEGVLAASEQRIDPRYRSYLGEFHAGSETYEGAWVIVVWSTISGQIDAVIASQLDPTALIDYSGFVEPVCDAALEWRKLNIGGPAPGDWPEVDQNVMIVKDAQCINPGYLTKRTIVGGPFRLVATENERRIAVQQHHNGLVGTLQEARSYASDTSSINNAELEVQLARSAFSRGDFPAAIDHYEMSATIANDDAFCPEPSCPAAANFGANVLGRSLTMAFLVHSLFLYAEEYEPYLVPDLGIPLLLHE